MSTYFDNAATMEIDASVHPSYYSVNDRLWWRNPATFSQFSKNEELLIVDTQDSILDFIGGHPKDKIIFTSGGTESNNLAIKGWCFKKYQNTHLVRNGDSGQVKSWRETPQVFFSRIEHPSVIQPIAWLYESGIISYYSSIAVDTCGRVCLDDLGSRLKMSSNGLPIFVSVMLANNEIGCINDIKAISELVHKYNGVLHVDAVQAFGHMVIDVDDMGIDMLSASGHKFGTPHGIGFLYIKEGIEIDPLIHGGGQQDGLRSGTESVSDIAVLNYIVLDLDVNFDVYRNNENYLRETLYEEVDKKLTGLVRWSFNTPKTDEFLPNINSLVLEGIDNEKLITLLDQLEHVQVSAGSACHAGTREPSQVLWEIGLSEEEINNTIRISFNRYQTADDIRNLVDAIVRQVKNIKLIE